MRIERRAASPETASRLRADIDLAALSPGRLGRVCGEGCTAICARCGSTSCQCACSPTCPDAPRTLSSEPGAFQIEPRIVALVYAMASTDLLDPCWSCEGHLGPDGSLWKKPTVWFYCEATAHVRLLADGLSKLALSKRLSTPWRVVVTYSDPDNPRTTFAIEPALEPGDNLGLDRLQADAAEIAAVLPAMLTTGGRVLRAAAPLR